MSSFSALLDPPRQLDKVVNNTKIKDAFNRIFMKLGKRLVNGFAYAKK